MAKYWVMYSLSVNADAPQLDAMGVTLPKEITSFEEIPPLAQGMAQQILRDPNRRFKVTDQIRLTVLTLSKMSETALILGTRQ